MPLISFLSVKAKAVNDYIIYVIYLFHVSNRFSVISSKEFQGKKFWNKAVT